MKRLFLILLPAWFLFGCTTAPTKFEPVPYTQFKVVDITEIAKPVEVPKFPLLREEFVALSAEEQRNVIARYLTELAGALRTANDRLRSVLSAHKRAVETSEEENKKIRDEVEKVSK